MPKRSYSRRAEILKRALDLLNQRRYLEHNGYMIFGMNYSDMLFTDEDTPEEFSIKPRILSGDEREPYNEVAALLSRLTARLDRDRGRRAAMALTSLAERPDLTEENTLHNLQEELAKLSPHARAYLRNTIKGGPEANEESEAEVERDTEDSIDLLDLYYSYEVLAKLERAVQCASGLEYLEPALPSPIVNKYLKEAHQCYLYGFPSRTNIARPSL